MTYQRNMRGNSFGSRAGRAGLAQMMQSTILLARKSARPRKAPATITKPMTTAVAWPTCRRSGHCTRCSSRQLPRRKVMRRLPSRGSPRGGAAAARRRRPRRRLGVAVVAPASKRLLGVVDAVLELLELLLVLELGQVDVVVGDVGDVRGRSRRPARGGRARAGRRRGRPRRSRAPAARARARCSARRRGARRRALVAPGVPERRRRRAPGGLGAASLVCGRGPRQPDRG